MQQSARTDVAACLNRLIAEAVPNQRGLEAWTSLLRAHATLVRQLATDLVEDIGLTLGEFRPSLLNLGRPAANCA